MSFVLIQYPGIVKNVEKALVTLGGVAKLSEDHFKSTNITLDYHRDNIYSKGTTSRKVNRAILILRARRKKPKNSTNSDESEEIPVEVEVLGMARTFYQFNGMFDIQYLPMKRIEDEQRSSKYENILPKLVPQTIDAALSWFNENKESAAEEIDLFLPPNGFSRFSGVNSYVLCRETERKVQPSKPVHIGASLRADRKSQAIMVQGQDDFPKETLTDLTKGDIRFTLPEPNNEFQKVFNDRPIWTKHGVAYLTKLEPMMIKTLLPKYAFYILSGPWGRTWCRFGYDPRIDPEGRKYQTLMINARMESRLNVSTQKALIKSIKPKQSEMNKSNSSASKTDHSYIYRSGELPPFRQMFYQICDIHLPEATALLDRVEEKWPAVADASLGWFRHGDLDDLREVIKADVHVTLRKLDRDELVDFDEENNSLDDFE